MDIDEDDLPDVTCAKLQDGKVSIRLDGKEVYLLPARMECRLDDLETALATTIGEAIKLLSEPEAPADDEGWW